MPAYFATIQAGRGTSVMKLETWKYGNGWDWALFGVI